MGEKLKVRVKLYGTLSKFFTDYDPATGIDLEIPDGTRVRDVSKLVNVSEESIGLVTIKGKIVKADAIITEGDEVKFFQPIAGG